MVQPSTSAAQQAQLFGGRIAPPDQGLCVGASQLIDVVNSYLVVRSTVNGARLSAPTSLTTFFQAGLPFFDVFDPRCEWLADLWHHLQLFTCMAACASCLPLQPQSAAATSSSHTVLLGLFQ